jgi:TolB protein
MGALNLTRFEGDDRAPAWSPDGRTIVFQSNREGQIDIYRMDADGSGVARLTSDPADDTDPSVSPDGGRIVFVSTRGGDADIFVMNIDGAGASDVTRNDVDDRAPSWNPHGAILFTSVVTDGTALFAVQPDGSGSSRIADGVTGVSSAAWQPIDVDPAALTAGATSTPTAIAPPFELPEGAFAFASNREGQFDLFRADFDGENLTVLSDLPNDERHPALSPALSGVEGSQLAFDVAFTNTQRIFVVDLGSSAAGVITLTQATESAHSATWSPDGTLIAYEVDAERGPDVVLVRPDGSGAARLISRPGYDGCVSWRPEDEQIAFTSDRDGDLNVYLVNVDGTDVKRLTQHAGLDRCPAWSPDGDRIAFISNRNGEGVYLTDAEGANVRLFVAISGASQPAWSPDGRFLLVASDQDGDFDVYLIAVDEASIWNLTADSKADEVDPVWTR